MFRNKEYILTIVREGGFSKAAEKLYISQPALSATVKRIEEKLTVPIFDRTSTPIALTEVGKEYVKHAYDIERMEQDLERYINDRVNLSVGEIKIGASSLFSAFLLPPMISEFNKKYPRVSIHIFENNSKSLIKELVTGNLDIIVDNAVVKNENISSIFYTSETLLLAVPASFDVNDRLREASLSAADVKAGRHLDAERTVELEEFIGFPFILLHSENDTGKRADLLFKKHGLNPDVIFRFDQQMTAYSISCSGLGISFISDTLVKNMASNSAMRYYRLSDMETARNIYFFRKKNRYYSLACQKFIEHNIKEEQA